MNKKKGFFIAMSAVSLDYDCHLGCCDDLVEADYLYETPADAGWIVYGVSHPEKINYVRQEHCSGGTSLIFCCLNQETGEVTTLLSVTDKSSRVAWFDPGNPDHVRIKEASERR